MFYCACLRYRLSSEELKLNHKSISIMFGAVVCNISRDTIMYIARGGETRVHMHEKGDHKAKRHEMWEWTERFELEVVFEFQYIFSASQEVSTACFVPIIRGFNVKELLKSPLPVFASRRAAALRVGLEPTIESSLGGSTCLNRRSAGEMR